PPGGIEILGCEPAFEGKPAPRPFAVEHGEPGRIATAALDHHMLTEDPLESEAKAARGAHRVSVERVAFPLVAAIAELVEDIAGKQVLGFRRYSGSLQGGRIDDPTHLDNSHRRPDFHQVYDAKRRAAGMLANRIGEAIGRRGTL